MSYPLVDPALYLLHRDGLCALAVMAKIPRVGRVKTRLSPPLTLEQSAALNLCFLVDTARNISEVASVESAMGVVCYTPLGEESALDGLLPEDFLLIPQRGDGFGERLFCAAQDLLASGFSSVCLIDSDSPTLPAKALAQAARELSKPGDTVVLGGSDDGGYYLIGLKQAHERVFEDIAWSTSSVYAETVERIQEANLRLVELPLWYDVDDAATLQTLSSELLEGVPPPFASAIGYDAQETRSYLRRLNFPGATRELCAAYGLEPVK